MAATSQLRSTDAFGEFIVNQWREAGLLKPSAIKPVITTIEKGLVIRTMGRLSDEDQRTLRETIQTIVG
jgi:mRNA interferase MazF